MLLKTKNGLVRTQMTPDLAVIALDPNGGTYAYIVLVRPLYHRAIYKIIISRVH